MQATAETQHAVAAFGLLYAAEWSGMCLAEGSGLTGLDNPELGPVRVEDETVLAVVGPDGEPGELAPDFPLEPLACSDSPGGRRARAFRRYWVSRVHEQFPLVVGSWEDASLACTRRWLCQEMRSPRRYYVRDANGSLTLKHKRGMHTTQIAACVDWLVTAAHVGTPAQAHQRAIRDQLRPNFLMRWLGLRSAFTVR